MKVKILIVSLVFLSCASNQKTINKTFKIKEGFGVDNIVFMNEAKENLIKKNTQSNKCKIIEGKFYKIDGEGYFDERKVVYKEVKDRHCYNRLGFNVNFKEDKVSKIVFESKDYITTKGIKIGDKQKIVRDKYGNDFRASFFEFPIFTSKKKINKLGLKALGFNMEYYDKLGIAFVYDKKNKYVQKIVVFIPNSSDLQSMPK